MTDENTPDLTDFIDRDDDDLLEALSEDVFGRWLGVSPRGRRRAIAAWLETWMNDNRDKFCAQPKIEELIKTNFELLEDAAVVLDVLTDQFNLPSAALAVILVRRGIKSFCGPTLDEQHL